MGRSPGFASIAADLRPIKTRFPFGSSPEGLNLPMTVTRRVIMQKARDHTHKVLSPLAGVRFQVLLTPLVGVLFIFRSRYLIHYRSLKST